MTDEPTTFIHLDHISESSASVILSLPCLGLLALWFVLLLTDDCVRDATVTLMLLFLLYEWGFETDNGLEPYSGHDGFWKEKFLKKTYHQYLLNKILSLQLIAFFDRFRSFYSSSFKVVLSLCRFTVLLLRHSPPRPPLISCRRCNKRKSLAGGPFFRLIW